MTWRTEIEDRIKKNFDVNERFEIEDVYEWAGDLKRRYPKNRHIYETLRDVLQDLRDDEVIEFRGERGEETAGEYKRLQ